MQTRKQKYILPKPHQVSKQVLNIISKKMKISPTANSFKLTGLSTSNNRLFIKPKQKIEFVKQKSTPKLDMVLLNQSDLMDASENLMIGDTTNEFNQYSSNIKEIVVNQSQVFQLKQQTEDPLDSSSPTTDRILTSTNIKKIINPPQTVLKSSNRHLNLDSIESRKRAIDSTEIIDSLGEQSKIITRELSTDFDINSIPTYKLVKVKKKDLKGFTYLNKIVKSYNTTKTNPKAIENVIDLTEDVEDFRSPSKSSGQTLVESNGPSSIVVENVKEKSLLKKTVDERSQTITNGSHVKTNLNISESTPTVNTEYNNNTTKSQSLPTIPLIDYLKESVGTVREEIKVELPVEAESASSASPTNPIVPISICRTCLKPSPFDSCHKLFDVGDNQKKANNLRRALMEMADFVDLTASLNPVVCNDCHESIRSAHAFQRKVKNVEEEVQRRKKTMVGVVDLKKVLEEAAQERLNIRRSVVSSNAPVDLEQYLEKRKRIIDQYMTTLTNKSAESKNTGKESQTEEKNIRISARESFRHESKTPEENSSNSGGDGDDSSLTLLDSIIKDIKNGDKIFEFVNVDAESKNTGKDTQTEEKNTCTSVGDPLRDEPKKPEENSSNSGGEGDNSSLALLDSIIKDIKNGDNTFEIVNLDEESNLENVKTEDSALVVESTALEQSEAHPIQNVTEETSEVEEKADPLHCDVFKTVVMQQVIDDVILQENNADLDSPKRKKRKATDTFCKVDPGDGWEVNLDTFLAKRNERCKQFRLDNAQYVMEEIFQETQMLPKEISNAMEGLDKVQYKRPEDAYKCMFKSKCKKPDIPKTFDLFDDKHDSYFSNLHGEPDDFMKAKWKRFSESQPYFGEPPYLCQCCGKIFKNKYKLNQHVKIHEKSEIVVCSVCGIEITNDCLRDHMAVQHKRNGLECRECGKKFLKKSMLYRHEYNTHKPAYKLAMSQCQICGVLVKKRFISVHLHRHNLEGKTYACDVCGKVLANKVTLYAHRTRHVRTRLFTCPICLRAVQSWRALKGHMKNVHGRQTGKTCDICQKTLSKRESMARHLRIKHGKPTIALRKKEQIAEDEEIEQATNFISEETPASLIDEGTDIVPDDLECKQEDDLECKQEDDLECKQEDYLECAQEYGLEYAQENDLECAQGYDLECAQGYDLQSAQENDLDCAQEYDLECAQENDLECAQEHDLESAQGYDLECAQGYDLQCAQENDLECAQDDDETILMQMEEETAALMVDEGTDIVPKDLEYAEDNNEMILIQTEDGFVYESYVGEQNGLDIEIPYEVIETVFEG